MGDKLENPTPNHRQASIYLGNISALLFNNQWKKSLKSAISNLPSLISYYMYGNKNTNRFKFKKKGNIPKMSGLLY